MPFYPNSGNSDSPNNSSRYSRRWQQNHFCDQCTFIGEGQCTNHSSRKGSGYQGSGDTNTVYRQNFADYISKAGSEPLPSTDASIEYGKWLLVPLELDGNHLSTDKKFDSDKRIAPITQPVGHGTFQVEDCIDTTNLFSTLTLMRRQHPFRELLQVLSRTPTVIFCISDDDVEELAREIRCAGYIPGRFHSGMSHRYRMLSKKEFQKNAERTVLITTMGLSPYIVHPCDGVMVIHAAMPPSLKVLQANSNSVNTNKRSRGKSILFFHQHDVARWEKLLRTRYSDEPFAPLKLSRALRQLGEMQQFCLRICK